MKESKDMKDVNLKDVNSTDTGVSPKSPLDDFDFDELLDPVRAPDAPEEGDDDLSHQIKPTQTKNNFKPELQKRSLVERVKANWMYLLGGVVVIAIGGYIISSIFSSAPNVPKRVVANSPSFSKLSAAPASVKIASVPASAQTSAQTQASPAIVLPTSTRFNSGVNGGIASAAQATTMTPEQSQLSSLSTSMGNLQTFLQQSVAGDLAYQHEARQSQANMALQMSLLQQQVNGLNTALNTQNQNMVLMTHELSKTQQELQLVLAQKMQDVEKYTLRAVVPGQAWLVNEAGQTVTLSMGTELKNYGKVIQINTNLGTVTMSSGYVFS